MPKRSREEDIDAGTAPTGIDPYNVLGLEQDATQSDVKRAYRKAALRHHPDKAAPDDKESAHTQFQKIAFAYAILSDERRRKRYDTTGRVEEIIELADDGFDWATYYREQFAGVVTEATINKFADEYKGSDEERTHVLEAYEKTKGNMVGIYARVMLSDMLEDEDRFRAMIDKAIADGDAEPHAKYTGESEKSRHKRFEQARKRKEKECKAADEAAKEIKENKAKKGKTDKGSADMGDLVALIQQRQAGRAERFFDKLEAKYAPKGEKGKQGSSGEPSEEAFAANRTNKRMKR